MYLAVFLFKFPLQRYPFHLCTVRYHFPLLPLLPLLTPTGSIYQTFHTPRAISPLLWCPYATLSLLSSTYMFLHHLRLREVPHPLERPPSLGLLPPLTEMRLVTAFLLFRDLAMFDSERLVCPVFTVFPVFPVSLCTVRVPSPITGRRRLVIYISHSQNAIPHTIRVFHYST